MPNLYTSYIPLKTQIPIHKLGRQTIVDKTLHFQAFFLTYAAITPLFLVIRIHTTTEPTISQQIGM